MKHTKGWHGERIRHSQARRFGRATPKVVDLKKYSGTWEQTKVVNEPSFQRGCEKVTASYTPLAGGKIKVTNRCYKKGERVNKIVGSARSVSKNNKDLKVTFFPPFEGDYKITKLNPSYTRAVVKSGNTRWYLNKIK